MEFTMSKTFKIAGAAAVLLGLAGPVLAQVDVANISVGSSWRWIGSGVTPPRRT